MTSLLDNPRPTFTLLPSSLDAREAGCTCPDLPEMLEYSFVFTDCSQEQRCWITSRRDGWPDKERYVLAHDKVMVSQMRISRKKIKRCPVHTGEVDS